MNLRRATGVVTAAYDEALAPAGLTLNQFSILSNLGQLAGQLGAGTGTASDTPAPSVSALAIYLGLERSTLTRNLKVLEADGLVEDASAPGKRDHALRLSAAGVAKVAEAYPLWMQAQTDFEALVGPEDAQALKRILRKLETGAG